MNAVLDKRPVPMKISNLQSGFQILSRLPLANSRQAALEINYFLDSLLQTPPQGEVYLQLLEQTRISLCFIEEELARCYINKALPLGDFEASTFHQVVATWLKAARAYSHCAQMLDSDSDVHAERLALILHRCIFYTGMVIIEHHRARQELPAGVWLNLHGYYASAEEWGIATLPVPDSLDSLGRSSHCTAAYISLLLAELASPYSLSIADISLVRRWVSNWSPLVGMHPAVADEPLPPFVVDLMQDCGLRASSECLQREHLRRLDTSRLVSQLNQVKRQLQQRIPPAQLGLGEDCTAAQCHRLLNRLYKPWCMLRAARRFRRHNASGTSKVSTGFSAMHYHISGKEFQQPEVASIYSRQEFESLFAFRHMLDPTQMLEVRQVQLGFGFDTWEVLDQCANGFRLLRSVVGKKVEPGQLLSICPHDGNSHLLAQVAWLMQEEGGSLIAGIAALPGKPQAVAARGLTYEPGRQDPYHRAFLLPAVPAIGSEQTLILPPGWYRPERLLEVYTENLMQVRLQRLVADGADFERVSFIVV
ncbi:MAG: hypothetical protein ABTS16_21620 [Candidatus Accumulibacter phosphatis]|jgi:hypothetical protein|uniref:Molecular chaperone n=2 Tax=Candidatus Accumulibacter TaxID=327159 RepID=A0A080M2V1_9PROT|nr:MULTISPECIES: hypothetical protein [Candidatus Accumulibacter]KFB71514.1 MAG: hypothetical protein AW09_003340 [Candidatus Accumulibacter phosphatis]MBL8408494.1 hypothetical protein [Accumulibacter sp.]NMQ05782.1 hypothetical protein [Candidatus Accumulibacter contiguus]HRF12918.1 hypothetical protein [Candidatus Accumulibacter phosphatis]